MKKLFLALGLLVAGATTAFAQQKGDIELGAGLNFTGSGSWLGLQGKARYNITDQIRLAGGVAFYLPKSDGVGDYKATSSFMSMSADVHYLFPIAPKFVLYPLAGLGFYHSKISIGSLSNSRGDFALNLGGGGSYQLTPNISVGAELKFALAGHSNSILGVNVMFKL